MNRNSAGFTLTELLITVAIVATITAVAVPSYRQYIMRANRADATTALLRLAANQERFYLASNTYASNAQLATAPPNGLGLPGTDRGLYTLTIAAAAGGLARGYRATATAVASESQGSDDDCASFSVDNEGRRTAADSGGVSNTEVWETCWR